MEKYWRSIDEIENGSAKDEQEKAKQAHNDDVLGMLEGIPLKASASRRDFLKIMSYSAASAALLAACKRPVQNAIPFLIQPSDVVPGKASHYASTFFDGSEYCPVVAKVRDGRPIKLEGNNLYKYTRGGTSARVQASILSLYDNARIKNPTHKDRPVLWASADAEIITGLEKAKSNDKQIVLLTSTIFSPSTLKAIEEFKSVYPNAKIVNYDVVSYSGIVDAYKETTEKNGIPYPLFDKADVIVSFGADFLGTWFFPTEFTLAYVSKRKVAKGYYKMSRHIQYESSLSLTGSNADERIQIRPSEESVILANLYNLIASKIGWDLIDVEPVDASFKLEKIAAELLGARGRSIVVSGSNDANIQKIVIGINRLLDNYGNTFDIERPMLIRQGSDKEMFELINDMDLGKVGAIFFHNTNPCHDYYSSAAFIKALEAVELKVSLAGFPNETMPYCDYVCPENHFLESWGDFEPRTGIYSISQPCIHRIFDTRQMQESLMVWAGQPVKWDEYMKAYWEKEIFRQQKETEDFEYFWIETLRNGCLELTRKEKASLPNIANLKGNVKLSKPSTSLELQLIVPIGITSEYHSNNPWLQEMPDPISRITWDNYAYISPKLASEKNIKTGDVINIGNKCEIPAVVQPGQAYHVISVALNYGRTKAGKVAEDVGVDMYPYIIRQGDNIQYFQSDIGISNSGKKATLAQTQTHHTMEGRDIVRETTLAQYAVKPNAGNEAHEEFEKHHQTLYPERKFDGFHWGMGI
ncbi:MAG TPA: TAT-variant-translocated molybdopterin oxidoreductase, partial [Bacteroidales bacterium]